MSGFRLGGRLPRRARVVRHRRPRPEPYVPGWLLTAATVGGNAALLVVAAAVVAAVLGVGA